jgi:hypothetical protein
MLKHLAAVAIVLAALTGCDVLSPSPGPPCPPVSIIDETASLVQFKDGGGRDITDVSYGAEFQDVRWSCDYGEMALVVELELLIEAGRGPTFATSAATLRYFVALADRQERIIAKRVFDVAVAFEGDARVHVVEEIVQRIGLRPGQVGIDFVILVGFQLDRDQLEYNRDRLR